MKKSLALLLIVAAVAACKQQEPAAANVASASAAHEHHHSASAGEAPAAVPASNDPEALNASVLDPNTIQEYVARDAYVKAKQVGDRLDKMYCYCHCARNEGHKSLLTCFQTTHAAGCMICQQEATQVWIDMKQGRPVEASQKWANDAFNGGAPPPKV